MNKLDSLPPILQSKFGQLQRRIRVARLLRGVAGSVVALVGLFLAAFLVEALVGWPVSGLRGVHVVLWMATGIGVVSTLVMWQRSLPWPHLAALVERRFPILGERLASTVELQQAGLEEAEAGFHGSPELIRWLRDETVERAAPLDFREAYGIRAPRKLAAAALGLLLAALTPLLGSDAYARFGRRVLFAWSPSVHGYTLEVSPGDQYVARGRSAAVTAKLAPLEDGVHLPATCVLVYEEGGGAPRRLRMEAVDDATFSVTWPVVQDSLRYHVQAGDLVSPTYRLDAVDPVALAPDNPTVKVAPPPYVNPKTLPALEHAGQTPFTALQYSRSRFMFAFDRPARKATIRWRADSREQTLELELSGNRRDARWETTATLIGPQAAMLILEGEHGIVSSYALPDWSVWTDDGPWFSAAPVLGIAGSGERPKVVAPDDVIPIKAVAEDQVGVDRVELEYRINNDPTQTILLANGHGETRVATDMSWRLQGLAKPGDTLACRLRATDNRRLRRGEVSAAGETGGAPVPDRDLGPNVAYLPDRENGEDRWWSFKVELQAEPLAKQEAAAQRDEFHAWIERIKKQLEQERQQVRKVKLASHPMPVLTAEQASQVKQARQWNQVSQQELRSLGSKAAAVAGLQNLARLSFDIARRELGDSDAALQDSLAKDRTASRREAALDKADQALQSALERLGTLRKMNELLAQERLDLHDLQQLAHEEQELAKQAEAAAADPHANAKELERLQAEQAKLRARVQELADKNPRLQAAARQARQARMQALAKQAHHLAMQQRKLSQEAEAQWQAELKTEFASLAKQQRDLAGKAEKLGRAAASGPAGAVGPMPHRPALAAADRLGDGDIESALEQQQAAQGALQALGAQLDKAFALGRDPRAAIQKLARMQDDLIKQLEKLGADFARLPIDKVRAQLAEITRSQQSLHDAVGKLETPSSQERTRQQVHDVAGEAARALLQSDALGGFFKMEEARDALQAWARQLPETAPPATGKDTPEERLVKQQAGQARQLAKSQHELREATRRLLAELAKSQGGSAERAQQKQDVDQLAEQLMELSQRAGPETNKTSRDAAHAAQMAQKAMAKSQADKEQGKMKQARAGDAESALQLQMAAKKLDEASAAMAPARPDKDSNDAALQQAFREGQMKLEQAQQQLQQSPKDAAHTMRQAAQALGRTVKQAQQSAGPPSPSGGGMPAQSFQGGAARASGEILAEQLQAHAGKGWGELPGELRTRIVQDLRARYGDAYGPIIQRYFQRIADVPADKTQK
ncbi:MAG: hypothetical protein L0Y71_24305 [Gemmataceae bacterium]|nr:hypothetical protein [Gemmataceae bacterium]